MPALWAAVIPSSSKQLRTANETTNGAIAKMKEMRAHAHQFAEVMLEYAASEDAAPDRISCWTAFSGLLIDEVVNNADWGECRPKKQSASSRSVYDIAKFDQVTGSATMSSPAPHVAYHFTAAKVQAPELVVDYEPLQAAKPISAAFKDKGKAAAKRKHGEMDGSDGVDEDENDADDNPDSG